MIDSFIQQLATMPPPANAYNPYYIDSPNPNNALRRRNFERYLKALHARSPSVLMVMEAPGYRGCRLTGVPVTSRKLLLEGVPEVGMFGIEQGYENPTDTEFARIQGEQSATIVWGLLRELRVVPVIWNTYPFHPHRPDEPLTNRKPRKPEIAIGMPFVEQMITMFTPQHVIAVGNVAYDTLTSMGVNCDKVRHPAQGGKNDFVAGMTTLLG